MSSVDEPRRGGAAPTIEALVERSSVIICCGSGGVGKTTTSAVIALSAARLGRRVALVTIDPARRLADALGLERLANTPTRIEGDWSGELSALMLDTKNTFDALIERYAPSADQRDRILANPFYRNISGTLSGTQEYMAAEKLFELHETDDFDLVVVDTPPTRNALDFLNAPDRLSRFLNHPMYRLLTAPTRGLVRAVNFASQTVLRSLTKVIGGEVITDAIAFFQAFDGMEEGFRQRSARVGELLQATSTAYVLVTSPRSESLDEAEFFADRLAEDGIDISALIVNRMHPYFPVEAPSAADPAHATTIAAMARADELLASQAEAAGSGTFAQILRCRAAFRSVAAQEVAAVERLRARTPGVSTYLVPFLVEDVHDLAGMLEMSDHLHN
jgi:anion-transporting  ArsA/GET3 family ATPase